MFEIGGYVLSAVIAIVGLTKWKAMVPIIKGARELILKYNHVTGIESAGGKKITEDEWKELAKEALDLVKQIVTWWNWRSQKK